MSEKGRPSDEGTSAPPEKKYRVLNEAFAEDLKSHAPAIATAIASATLVYPSLSGLGMKDHPRFLWWWFCLVIAGICYCLAVLFTVQIKPRRSALIKKVRDLDGKLDHFREDLRYPVRLLADYLLDDLSQALDEIDLTSLRVSIYYHKRSKFILVERKSRNPRLEEIGRDYYPDDQGFISEVWEQGISHGDIEVIESDTDEDSEKTSLVTNAKNTGIPEEIATKIIDRMRTRSYVGLRIESSREPIGIVLFESSKANGLPASCAQLLQNQVDQRKGANKDTSNHLSLLEEILAAISGSLE